MPETLSFLAVLLAEFLLVGVLVVLTIVFAMVSGRIRYLELRAVTIALLLTVAAVGHAATRYDTPIWRLGLWALAGLAVALVAWAALFYVANALITRDGE